MKLKIRLTFFVCITCTHDAVNALKKLRDKAFISCFNMMWIISKMRSEVKCQSVTNCFRAFCRHPVSINYCSVKL